MAHEGTLVGTVRGLYRYPIKSTAGEELRTAQVGARGLQHDRRWAIYTEDGGIASGKRTRRFRLIPGLMHWSSRIEDDHEVPVLVSPDGARYRADDAVASQSLSEVFGRQLKLRYETTIQHHDETPLHLITTSSLQALAGLSGQSVDERRFRPNIVIDTGTEADFRDDDWIGAELAIGNEVCLGLGPGMPRCVMIDQPQRGVAAEPKTLKLLGTHHKMNFGLQVDVIRTGIVCIGDQVVLHRPEVAATSKKQDQARLPSL